MTKGGLVRKSRFTEERMIAALKEARGGDAGDPPEADCRRVGSVVAEALPSPPHL
jgi:hypothetical protein